MKTSFSISKVLKESWRALISQFWVLVGLVIGYTIIVIALAVIFPQKQLSIITLVSTLVNMSIGILFGLGYTKNMFEALDGDEPQFSAFTQQAAKFFKSLGASILVGIGAFIYLIIICLIIYMLPGESVAGNSMYGQIDPLGMLKPYAIPVFLVLLLPMFYVSMRLQFILAVIVAENAGSLQAIKRSWEITEGESCKIILLFLTMLGFLLLGCICLLIGLFVAIPFLSLIQCAAYRELRRNSAAEEETMIES
ncbi:MAG: glycerophosphoryl diester phosphodiesterase membrane domain-containing protein [Tannerellaceae bacterium]|jgi:hypothetical protein|nr:glycerophosphoryl diester phosphodiesterase membrane domain-containing protein [Tannerellaceae bacterium]